MALGQLRRFHGHEKKSLDDESASDFPDFGGGMIA
jgi:hypothetical protein